MVPIPVDLSTVASVLKDVTGLTERIMKMFRDRPMRPAIAAHYLEMFRQPEHPFRKTERRAALIDDRTEDFADTRAIFRAGHGILVAGFDPGTL